MEFCVRRIFILLFFCVRIHSFRRINALNIHYTHTVNIRRATDCQKCAVLSIRNISGKQAAMPRIVFSTIVLIEQEQ